MSKHKFDTHSGQDKGTNNIKAIPKTGDALAYALSHDIDEGNEGKPPVVVAGGRGHVAEQILQIAFSCGVKVREDKDLVQMLASVDIDSEIPTEAFSTVAEILSYLYRYNNQSVEIPLEEGAVVAENDDIKQQPLQASDLLSMWTKGQSK